ALAASTAFRRGNGEPFKYFFPEKQFTLSMVAQLREGTDVASLGAENEISFAADSAGKCKAGNPGVYEIKAVTAGGGNWSYSASVIPLYKMNYVTDACDRSQYYYAHTATGGEYVPLCDFLFGDSNCVRPVDHMVLAAESEATDAHITPIPVPSWFYGLAISAGTCKGLSTAYTAAWVTTTAAIEKLKTDCGLLATTCPKPCSAAATVGPAVIGLDTAYFTEYSSCLDTPSLTASCSKPVYTAITALKTATATGAAAVGGDCPTCAGALTACAAAVETFGKYFSAEVADGTACDGASVKAGWDPLSWDSYLPMVPAVLLPRGGWLTCYAYRKECKLTCSKRSAYAITIPLQNQKLYFIHVGLTKSCLPNPLGLSVILAAFDAVANDMLHVNMGAFGKWAPLLGTGAVGLMDAVSDPFYPEGVDSEEIPPKGSEGKASEASSASLDKKLGELIKSLAPQIATTAIQSKTSPSEAAAKAPGEPKAVAGAAKPPQ
ncbi:MAG: hypothetical protein NTY90_00380, partial [Candidatus Micrarchaeota archaeon]|nr:hypothetical protein [Candidatus Micrarchaeota archaeon]